MHTFDITAIITAHREGRLAVATLRSFFDNVRGALDRGISVETIFVLDNHDEVTGSVFRNLAGPETRILTTEFGDQGKARNLAVDEAKGQYIAFLDADDLWEENWLSRAHSFARELNDPKVIVHPEFNYFFEGQATIYRHIDQLSEEFDLDSLRLGNYWDALCYCHRSVYEQHRFCERDVASGWAYEDWHWNMITIEGGCIHRVLPSSVLFKRRRSGSQTIVASTSKTKVRDSELFDYSFRMYTE